MSKTLSPLFHMASICILAVLVLTFWHPFSPTNSQVVPTVQAASESDCNSTRSVQTTGTAVVYVQPDRALIQLGVQSNGASPDAVHEANRQQIQKVTAAVRALGVDPKDIATDYYIVTPVYESYDSLTIKGYRVINTVAVTLKDVNLADDVIIAALKAGANEVQNAQFYTSELRKYRDQARDMAMKAAGEKAGALSAAGGAQVGCMLTASENIISQYYGSWQGGRGTAMWMQNAIQNITPGEAAPFDAESPISLGQISVQAQVTVSYSLK